VWEYCVPVVLALAIAGMAVLFCANTAAMIWRKEGVTVEQLWLAGSAAAAHPERYVRADRADVVRVLNYVGVGLFLASVVVMVVMTIRHP